MVKIVDERIKQNISDFSDNKPGKEEGYLHILDRIE